MLKQRCSIGSNKIFERHGKISKQTNCYQYVCFCSATISTSKTIKEFFVAATMLHRPEPTKEKVEPTTIGIKEIEIPTWILYVYSAITDANSTLIVANNHQTTTTLNFLVPRIAAMNLFQLDFNKLWNYPWYCYKKSASALVAPFFEGLTGQCHFHFPVLRGPC